MRYFLIATLYGEVGLVWQENSSGFQIEEIFLPSSGSPVINKINQQFPEAVAGVSSTLEGVVDRIQSFLIGEDVRFGLDWINLKRCSPFQTRVLRAEHGIPRGWVSTYGRIAASLGKPGGARAVGNALARNPFPIIIPCHRAVRANGDPGGFQGGKDMKVALLRNEGVELTSSGRVIMKKVFY